MAWQDEMVGALKQAVNGEKDRVIEEYRALTGKSAQTLYRIAARHGYESGRRQRVDKGRTVLTDHQLDLIFAMIQQSGRDRKGAIMPVEKALIDAERNGLIEPGIISPARLQALLREKKTNARALQAPEPHIPMRSLYPNHVHQVDASVCIQYYLKPGAPLQILARDLFYKNKFENYARIKRKIIRWVLTDHYSGTIFVKYYQSEGERADDLFDFLCSAWEFKHEKLPFRGVCDILMMDPGAANKSALVVNWLSLLGVRVPPGNPHTPTRNGSVEKGQDIVERWFESGLRFNPASTIEELNAWALDWCIWYNGERIHTRHGMTRTQCWLRIGQENLRELPDRELLQALFARPEEERTVSSRYSISFRPAGARYARNEYSLRHIPDLAPGDKVLVVMRPFDWPAIGVKHQGAEYAASPILTDDAGFNLDAAVIDREFKSLPETPVQQAAKRAENLAYGDDRKKGAVPFSDLTVMGGMADRIGHDFIPRRGTPITVDREGLSERHIPIAELMKSLISVGGPLSPAMNRLLREAYGKSIPRSEAERLVDEYASAGTLTPGAAAPAAAAGGSAC